MAAYTASKHGVVGLIRALAVELAPRGVTVNCICPGPIRTGMTAGIPDEAKEKFARRRVPMRRYGDPEEVAQITVGLVLPASSYLTGAVIPRSEEHTSELQSLMRISYAVFCLKKQKPTKPTYDT